MAESEPIGIGNGRIRICGTGINRNGIDGDETPLKIKSVELKWVGVEKVRLASSGLESVGLHRLDNDLPGTAFFHQLRTTETKKCLTALLKKFQR